MLGGCDVGSKFFPALFPVPFYFGSTDLLAGGINATNIGFFFLQCSIYATFVEVSTVGMVLVEAQR